MKIRYLNWRIKVFRSFSLASVSTFSAPNCHAINVTYFITSLQLVYLYFYCYELPTWNKHTFTFGLPITHCWELNCSIKKIKKTKKINNNNRKTRKKKTEKSKHRIKVSVNWNFWLPWAGFTRPERPSRNWLIKKKSSLVWDTLAQPVAFSRFRAWYFVWT